LSSASSRRPPGLRSVVNGVDRGAGAATLVTLWAIGAHTPFDREVLGDMGQRLPALGDQLESPEIDEVAGRAQARPAAAPT
jgi:hypothetical protein